MSLSNPIRHVSQVLVVAAVSLAATGVVSPTRDKPPPASVEDHSLAAHAAVGFEESVRPSDDPEMAGLTWRGGAAAIEVRGHSDDGWTEWVELHGDPSEGPDLDSPEHSGLVSAGPAWLARDVDDVEVRMLEGNVADLALHVVDADSSADASPLALPTAEAMVATPGITSRAQWGANESISYTQPGCEGGPTSATGGLTNAIVHHSASSNSYGPSDSAALIRGIQAYHVNTNGWCDIAYNFVIDRYGQVFEGRKGGITKAIIGGHSSGFNTGSTGVVLLGDFSIAPVPSAAYGSLVQLLSWKLAYHGVDPRSSIRYTTGANTSARWPQGTVVVLRAIGGHRDTNVTACPGDFAYGFLDRLREDVGAGAAARPDKRMLCDWNGDGTDTPGVWENGVFMIRNDLAELPPSLVVRYGNPTDTPLCGDWNGDGVDTVGVYRGGAWYLSNSNTSGVADLSFRYADPGEYAVVGDWDGNGTDTPGVVRSAGWFLTNRSANTFADTIVRYGDPGDFPVVGDWDGNGTDTIGVVRSGTWYLLDKNVSGFADRTFSYGSPTDRPIPSDYDANGTDTPGVARGAYWWLRSTNTSGSASRVLAF
jgi:hypothetical protein